MTLASRFRCPACDFTVFNRRVVRCESCGAPLPESLRYTPEQLAAADAEAARNEKTRADLADWTSDRRRGGTGGDGGSFDLDFGDAGDGGGGGDGGGD